jgi:uncharacterized membrane protein
MSNSVDAGKSKDSISSHPWAPLRVFVAGAAALLPVFGTALLLWVAVSFIYDWVGPASRIGLVLSKAGVSLGSSELLGYLIGLGVVVVFIFCAGVLVEFGLRRWIGRLSDSLMGRIPIVRTVYETLRNFVSMLSDSGAGVAKGMMPVWCRFGEVRVLGLLSSPDTIWIDGSPFKAVIVPTAPVPVGGGLFFLPENQVDPAKGVGVDGLASIYVSMGVTAPQFLRCGGRGTSAW